MVVWSQQKNAVTAMLAVAAVCGVVLGCATTHGQTHAELAQALEWFVPATQRAAWQTGSARPASIPRRPVAVIVWAPRPVDVTVKPARIPKVDRERWMASLQERLAGAEIVERVIVSSPDLFVEGLALEGIRTLGAELGADVLIVFNLEHDTQRYNVRRPGPHGVDRSGQRIDDVVNVIQILATARMIGITPLGYPLFSGSAVGYDEGILNDREDDVIQISDRVALEGVYREIVRRLRKIEPGPQDGEPR